MRKLLTLADGRQIVTENATVETGSPVTEEIDLAGLSEADFAKLKIKPSRKVGKDARGRLILKG